MPPARDLGAFFQIKQPIGTILMYGGSSLPANYLWCDGNQFNVPNFLNRIPIGGYTMAAPNPNYKSGYPIQEIVLPYLLYIQPVTIYLSLSIGINPQ